MSKVVLHVIARMNLGGTARYVGELVQHLPNNILATGYVQGSEIEDSCVGKLPVIRIPHLGRKISPINDLLAFLELRRIIHKVQPDILHTHTFKAGLIGRLIRGNHKRVHTFHGHLFEDQSFSRFQKIIITASEKFMASRTEILISVGEKVGIELREAGIGVEQKWTSIPPGVEPLPRIDKEVARKRLGLPSNIFIVGWMARVTAVKNPFFAVEIAKNLPRMQFVMAGGGDLLQNIQKHPPHNLKVIGWVDASEFWSATDCAISTSDNEGMPVALIEAQLAEIPVIATDVGSNSEVIEDGVTGFIVEKNIVEFTAAIDRLSHDATRRNLMGAQAAERATKLFSVSRFLNAHAQCYKQL